MSSDNPEEQPRLLKNFTPKTPIGQSTNRNLRDIASGLAFLVQFPDEVTNPKSTSELLLAIQRLYFGILYNIDNEEEQPENYPPKASFSEVKALLSKDHAKLEQKPEQSQRFAKHILTQLITYNTTYTTHTIKAPAATAPALIQAINLTNQHYLSSNVSIAYNWDRLKKPLRSYLGETGQGSPTPSITTVVTEDDKDQRIKQLEEEKKIPEKYQTFGNTWLEVVETIGNTARQEVNTLNQQLAELQKLQQSNLDSLTLHILALAKALGDKVDLETNIRQLKTQHTKEKDQILTNIFEAIQYGLLDIQCPNPPDHERVNELEETLLEFGYIEDVINGETKWVQDNQENPSPTTE